jgi:hypothetical protein
MNYLNEKMCQLCGGKCCMNLPGATLPQDWGEPLIEVLVKALSSGKWAIDWWEGDPTGGGDEINGYYIRPAHRGHTEIFHASWGARPCVFLGVDGCELGVEERPTGCRMLEPAEDPSGCIVHGASKQECAVTWMPYHDIILEAARLAERKKNGNAKTSRPEE